MLSLVHGVKVQSALAGQQAKYPTVAARMAAEVLDDAPSMHASCTQKIPAHTTLELHTSAL